MKQIWLKIINILKNSLLNLSLTFLLIYALLGAADIYFYEPHKYYKLNFAPLLIFSAFFVGVILRWLIQVITIYFLMKIFKGKVKFKSLLVILSFCTSPLIIYYIIDLILTYNIVRYFAYLLQCGYFVIVYFALAQIYRISGWKILLILVIVIAPFLLLE